MRAWYQDILGCSQGLTHCQPRRGEGSCSESSNGGTEQYVAEGNYGCYRCRENGKVGVVDDAIEAKGF